MNSRFAAGAAALAIAALAVVGCSSSSSSSTKASATPSATAMTGTETFSGSTTSLAQLNSQSSTVPISATGVFADSGSLSLAGGPGAGTGVVVLANGDVVVLHAAGKTVQTGPSAACKFTFGNTDTTYTIKGGTGKYKNLTGSGVANLVFTEYTAKVNGKCGNPNSPSTQAIKGSIAFKATGPVSLTT